MGLILIIWWVCLLSLLGRFWLSPVRMNVFGETWRIPVHPVLHPSFSSWRVSVLFYLFRLKFFSIPCISFFFFNYWSLVDFHCCVGFWRTAECFHYPCTYPIPSQILLPCRLLQSMELISLCCTPGPCYLRMLDIEVCLYQSRPPGLFLPPVFSLW